MLTASQILTLATQKAKTPGMTSQAASLLNGILADLCQAYDFAVARGLFSFTMTPTLASTIGGQSIYASGPYSLPLDYLRTSGSSGSAGAQNSQIWYLNGVPYPMIPCDLAEFDLQVQQAGQQSYPYIWATDMAQRSVVLTTTGTTHGSTTLDGLGSIQGLATGMTVQGPGIPTGTTISGPTGTQVTLSAAATNSAAGGTYDFGTPAVAYVWPPPSGAFSTNLRYQRQMPDLPVDANGVLTAAAAAQVPWFPNSTYLWTRLAGELMGISDDERQIAYLGDGPAGAQGILDRFLRLKDDDTNRVKTVQLDRRRFGSGWKQLPNTKTVGW